jgi:hypothetical protein
MNKFWSTKFRTVYVIVGDDSRTDYASRAEAVRAAAGRRVVSAQVVR